MDREDALLLAAGAGALLCVLVLPPIVSAGRRMRATGGPGLVALGRAESRREVNRYLRTWGAPGRAAAAASLRWGFLLIAGYVATLGCAGGYLAVRADRVDYGWLAVAEAVTAAAVALAGLLDAVENVALLRQLRAGCASASGMWVSRWCGQLNYALGGLAGLALLVGFGILRLAG